MLSHRNLAVLLFVLFAQIAMSLEQKSVLTSNQQLHELINNQIIEDYDFYGLAVYLNQVSYFLDNGATLTQINDDFTFDQSLKAQHLIIVGRYQAAVLRLNNHEFELVNGQLQINQLTNSNILYEVTSKKELFKISPHLDVIRYYQLWRPLALLSIVIEDTLNWLGGMFNNNWGLAIFLLAILIKLILSPLSIITSKSQQKVSQVQAKLLPQLREIKANFDGEKAHHKIMEAHKQFGVTPFFTLKPMFLTMLQLPFLIAIFNVLGEMTALQGESFMWVNDLSLPDMVLNFGYGIPLLGESLNIMPFIMTLVAIAATLGFKDENATPDMIKSQKIRLYLMALAFFVLFYPFPAAMVYYWAMANLLQIILQRFIK